MFTDGIVEARNSRGELFGFERLSDLLATHPDVGKIVDAAESFGQGEDDITRRCRLPGILWANGKPRP